jgi:3-oxoacyl-[acyl-carrier protein] reductase
MKLNGRVALVTGGSRGIGKAISLALAREGADVVVDHLEQKEEANEVVEEIRRMGRHALAFQTDVRDFDKVVNMVEQTMEEFGKIDILVNNAGIVRDKTFRNMKKEEWDIVIDTDLNGVFNCIKAVITHMEERENGKIINISSVIGEIGNFGQANYAAAKAGVIGLTKSVAKEVARKGITVNAVAPGFTETSMLETIPASIKEQILKQIPMGRFATPEDIAKVVVFLASDDANYITGQVINVNGGYYM